MRVGGDLFQPRKQFVRSETEGPVRLYSFKRHKQFLILAPTSKKDTGVSLKNYSCPVRSLIRRLVKCNDQCYFNWLSAWLSAKVPN